MQFSKIALLFSTALSVSAAPGPATLAQRSCGGIGGVALKVCQEACKVTCDLATDGSVRRLCKAACDSSLKARDDTTGAVGNQTVATGAAGNQTVATGAAGNQTDTSDREAAADKAFADKQAAAAKAAADKEAAATKEAAAAKEVTDEEAADLKALYLDYDDAQAGNSKISKRNWKRTLCDVACDVTCNSTVLALDQKECLKICKGKC